MATTCRRLITYLFKAALLMNHALALPSTASPTLSLSDISIAELASLLDAGTLTSHELTSLYLSRIAEVNTELHAIIEVDIPGALSTAAQLDSERASSGKLRGPLHGIPILIKDNYAVLLEDDDDHHHRYHHNNNNNTNQNGVVKMKMLTGAAAGSTCLLLLPHLVGRPATDAAAVARLRDAGAVILGKTNLDELSGARGIGVPHGWSARGGQTTGAYVERQTACGSSSGSAVAAALGLAAGALGTETAGSITCPAWTNNVVGIKPTVGLTSRHGIVPVTERQDTAGPLARTVADAALLLDAIAGRDSRDNWTLAQPWPDTPPRYATPAVLNVSALASSSHGKQRRRLGVFWTDEDAFGAAYFVNWGFVREVFERALVDLEMAGAEVVRVDILSVGAGYTSVREIVEWINGNMTLYAIPDGREAMQRYLDDLLPPLPEGKSIRTPLDLLHCIETDPRERASDFNTAYLEQMAAPNGTRADALETWDAYVAAATLGRSLVVDTMAEHDLDALVMFPDLAVILASAPGLPIVTVPMGALGDRAETAPRWDAAAGGGGTEMLVETAPGFPLGISFVADRWMEEGLISYAYAYEQVSKRRDSLRPYIEPWSDLSHRP